MQYKSELEEIAHDARKPLNHISMNAELLKIMVDKSISPEEIKKIADQIILSTKECSNTIQKMTKL
ncbi:histidine kinase [Pseudoalteromonas sp. JBTF-M23]|uniref:histidine kinase n=1 Tax=Pseudoalteromonas caenipelagi TaxID=2726988 RepID=A0A849VCT8_9GAMM|nr:histidine kinase dimerization/phospho-acceptor domain-containing protein [Pseudoalteromonas caenipelagi]NOU50610.1 histidine kinase [Pseudoalteromonas caenipelagi]